MCYIHVVIWVYMFSYFFVGNFQSFIWQHALLCIYIQVQEEMRNGEIALEKYVITKSLTKPPEDYPDAKNQPHVQVKPVLYLILLMFS